MFLTGDDLTIDQVVAVARLGETVELTESARLRITASRQVVETVAKCGEIIYGINTELGPLSKRMVPEEEIEEFQLRTILGHTVAFFTEIDAATVRAMILARANGFAKGGAGVRLEVAEKLLEMLNKRVHPIVLYGSTVGQSDLSEMSQIAQVLVGMGQAEYMGKRMVGGEALKAADITPLKLAAKEALALISSNGFTVGRGALVLDDARKTVMAFDLAAALSLEAYAGNLSVINEAAARLKPHPGHIRVSKRLNAALAGSYLFAQGAPRNLQDPLSFRCVPQVHGCLDELVAQLTQSLETELNSAADNPLVNIDAQNVVSVGNFDVTHVAVGFDSLRIALTHVINLANERIQKLVWAHFSDLPTGLEQVDEPLTRLIPLARTAATLTAEAQLLAVPASLAYRAQVSEGIEDHASSGPLTVQQTARLMFVARRIISIELLIAAAAIEIRQSPKLGAGSNRVFNFIREGPWRQATEWMVAIERLLVSIKSGELASIFDDKNNITESVDEYFDAQAVDRSRISKEPDTEIFADKNKTARSKRLTDFTIRTEEPWSDYYI